MELEAENPDAISRAEVLETTMTEQAKAAEFVDAIGVVRSERIEATEKKQEIIGTVQELHSTRESLGRLLLVAAGITVPVVGVFFVVRQIIKRAPPGSQEFQAAQQYTPEIVRVEEQIANNVAEYKAETATEQKAIEAEGTLANEYNKFADEAVTPLPAIEVQTASLPDKPLTPVTMDSAFLASVLGMEFIDPQVQRFIFEDTDFDDLRDPPTVQDARADEEVVDSARVKAIVPQFHNEFLDEYEEPSRHVLFMAPVREVMDQSAQAEDMEPHFGGKDTFKSVGVVAALLGFLYIVFGGER